MRSDGLLLAIDQGTTSTRVIAYDRTLSAVAHAAVPIETRHPQPDWAEQDPLEILGSVVETVARVLEAIGGRERVVAVGLDNQGESVVAWDAETLAPLSPVVVWHCRRSLPIVERLRAAGAEPEIRTRTGLPLDPYYSAGKIRWLLEHVEPVAAAARRGTLRVGTVDAWLTARLDGGRARTDPSTASRTQLYSLQDLDWDPVLAARFGVPPEALPTLVPTAGELGFVAHPRWGGPLPLRALACDQQAALAGHGGFEPGALKATYGTGVFVLGNAGDRRTADPSLETSVGWHLADGTLATILQGGVFTAGAFVDWLRDDLRLIDNPDETERLARAVPDTGGVEVLPALAGLGPPWWRPDARAVVRGLSAGTGRAHVVRAALDGLAHLVADLVEAMIPALGTEPERLRVDGGLTANGYLVARQADLLGLPVEVAAAEESTALGIAGLAGIGAGLLDAEAIHRANPARARFEPSLPAAERQRARATWRRFVEAVLRT
jgi:glycerol kinase